MSEIIATLGLLAFGAAAGGWGAGSGSGRWVAAGIGSLLAGLAFIMIFAR